MTADDDSRPSRGRPAIPTTVWMLGVVSLLMDVSSEMVQSLLPLYLVGGLGASALAVGFIEGLSVAVATATRFLSGVVADWSRRAKPLAVVGYGLAALSRLIFPLAATVDQIVLAKAMDRVGKGIRSTPRDAIVAGVTPPQIHGAAFGLRKSLDTVGGFLGPLAAVGAMLLLAGDIAAVYWLAVIPAVLAVAVLVIGVREPAADRAEKGWSGGGSRFRLAEAVRLNRAVAAVIGLGAVIMLARFSEAFVLLKALDAGVAATWVPLALVAMHAVYGLAAYPVGSLSDRVGSRGLLLCGLVFLVAAHLTLAAADTVLLYGLGTVLWGLHMGFTQGLLGALVAGAAPERLKGSAFGMFNLVTGLVVLTGNTAAGWLWTRFDPAVPFLAGAGLSVVAILWVLVAPPERAQTSSR